MNGIHMKKPSSVSPLTFSLRLAGFLLRGFGGQVARQAVLRHPLTRSVVCCLLSVVCAAPLAQANLTNTWQFTNAANYEVSNPRLIQVNPANGGRVELILQAEETDNSTVSNYLQWTRSDLSIGAHSSLMLTKGSDGKYRYPGVFRSRVLDKGAAGPWQLIVTDVDNGAFLSKSAKGEVPAGQNGLVGLYRFNNSWKDEISGQVAVPNNASFQFVTDAILGTHAATGWDSLWASLVDSSLLSGVSEFTITCWYKPLEFAEASGIIFSPSSLPFGFYQKNINRIEAVVQTTRGVSYAGTPLGSLPLGSWIFIAMTWRGESGVISLYINGALAGVAGSYVAGKGLLQQNASIRVGQHQRGAYARYDEVALWNRELSASEVQDLFLSLSAVDCRVRSGITPQLSGDFVGPDGTASSSFFPGARELKSVDNFNPFHRYVQYEVSVYSDTVGSGTPYLNSVKLLTSDGVVVHDSALADFQQAENMTLLTNYLAKQSTPYLGLARTDVGAFVSSGTYQSQVFDAGAGGFWQAVQWTSPAEVPTDATGLAGLWHLNGSWADSIGGAIGTANAGATLVTDVPKLGTGAANFDGVGANTTFALNKAVRSLELWIAPGSPDGGVLELNPSSVTGLVVRTVSGVLRLEGVGATGARLYLNASDRSRELLPGWNHVAVVLGANLTVTNMVLGVAQSVPWRGWVDELAVYNRELLKADVVAHFAQGVQSAGGRVTARVRYGNVLPLGGAFSGSYQSGQAIGIAGQRYFQFELELSGGGMVTPAVSQVKVLSSAGTFASATRTDFAAGDFGSLTAWYGDSVQLVDLADRGAVGLVSSGADSLAALWKIDEASWTTPGAQVLDSAGSRHGSPVGSANTESAGGLGLYSGKFGGSGAYVALPATPIPADFSVSVWFSSTSTNRSALVATELTGSRAYALELNGDGTLPAAGMLTLVLNGVGGQVLVPSQRRDLNDGRWHHVVAQRRGQQAHLYVDGVRENSAAISGAIEDYGAGPLYMARYGSDATYFTGYLDDFSIWGRALTPGEIGRISSAGFESAKTAMLESAVLDAGGASIWETIDWTSNGRFGESIPRADSGLVALWRADEVSGNLTNAVSSGTLAATASALTYGNTGVFKNAVGFNGSSAYAVVPHSTALEAANFSLSLWVYVEADNSRTIIDKRTAGAGYGLALDAQRFPVFWLSGNSCTAPIPVLREVWTHLAATFNGTTMSLYINGQLVSERVPVGVTVASAAALQIGRAYSGAGFFRGMMDDVAYYNRAIAPMEVVAHYRAGKGTMAFQIRTSDSTPLDAVPYVGPDGTVNTWYTAPSFGNLIGVAGLYRYFQYRGMIQTEDHRFSPTLYGVYVSASRYPENAPWISPTVAKGFSFLGELLGFDHTRTFNAGTDVKYQISGDGDASAASNRWFYYDSTAAAWTQEDPTNGPAIYTYQTSTKDQVAANIGSFYDQVYNATGGLFRFKAFLKSSGDQQIAVSNVTAIASRGRLVVVAPNGQERGDKAWISGVPSLIQWSWAGTVSDNLELSYSLDGTNEPFTVIATGLAKGVGGTNSYLWTTPQTPQGVPMFSNVVVRIRDLNDASVLDLSDDSFEITQKFKLLVPNGGERWYLGETNNITWQSAFDLSTRASLYMAPDGVNFFAGSGGYMIEFLATNANASAGNVYPWATPLNVPSLLSTNAKIRVQAPNGDFADESDALFSMVGLVVTRPTLGLKVKRGDDFQVEWRSIDAGTNVHVDVSLDGGATYLTNMYSFVNNVDGDNSLTWSVTQPESDEAVLRMRSLSDNRIIGYSEVFTIAGIDVLAPDGGEVWLSGSTNTIRWVAGGAGNTVSIYYTDLYDNTNTVWIPIAEGVPNTLSYSWVVTDRVSPLARVKVQSDEDPNLFAVSAQNFNIAGVRVTYPNLFNDTLIMGQQSTMTHAGAPMSWLRVKLEVSYDRAATWQVLGAGAEEWTLRQPFNFRPTFPSRQTKVRATVLGATMSGVSLTNVIDLSDEYFTVEGMLMEAPAGGSTNTLGTASEIRWVSAGADPAVSIYYSSQGTNNYQLLEQGVFNNQTYPGRNPYSWTVPTTLLPSANATIKVVSGTYQATTAPFILRGIRITTPTNGVVWNVGSSHPVAWQYAGMSISSRGSISLSLDGGSTFQVLENDYDLISIPFYDWAIGAGLDPTTNARVQLKVLSSANPADVGFIANSDRFTLKGVKILTPAAGGTVKLGVMNTISFIAAAAGSSATITYSADGGATYDPVPIVSNLAITNGLNRFDWNVELNRTPTTNAVIKVTGTADSKVSAPFIMSGIRVDRPLTYDIWAIGEVNTIEWVAQVANPVFNIDLLYPDNTTLSVAQNVIGSSRAYQLPTAALRGQVTISNVVLRVSDQAGLTTGLSAPFRLVDQPIIEVVTPVEGDYIRVGDEIQITWVKGGSMNAADFSVWFSGDGFATPPEDVARVVTFNPQNNTFSMPWVVPDRLGLTQIMVTNSANPTLVARSGEFNIVGSFELTFPNGDPTEEDLYANQTKAVTWFTQGTVPYVNIYYQVNGSAWVKANSTPVDNNPRQGRYQTVYQWTAPTLQADDVILRVQDADYPDPALFDGTKIGPYDDSDNAFALKYFTVTWIVGYMFVDEITNTNEFRELDKLSVTDSSGWSITGLDSPFVTNYPYGMFDTVWYRQFFNDKVDFRWLSDHDQTRTLILQPSDTEPDATVMANFTYDPGLEMLTIHSWIERGGRVLNNPDSTTVHIYDTDGTRLKQLSSSSVLAEGFFRIEWTDVLDTLTEGNTYLARVEVMYNRVIYSAAVTYTLSLAPEFQQVANILTRLTSMETNLTGQTTELLTGVTNLTAITTDFRDRAMGSLGTIEDRTGTMMTNIDGIAVQINSFTNTIVAPLAMLTNSMVGIIEPTLTNIAEQVQEILDSAAGDQARILNRPTTVEFGSTNTVLYKTSRGLDAGTVRLTVEGTGRQYNMVEVSSGLGIYGVDLIADWGLGSVVISCSDPTASDRMVMEVVLPGAGSMSELATTVTSLESQLTNVFEVINSLGDPNTGLDATLSSIDSSVTQIQAALALGGASGADAAAGAASALDALLNGSSSDGVTGDVSLLSSLTGISGRIDQIFGTSSDAAKFAMGAKNEAGSAANTARELKEMLTSGDYSMETAMNRLDAIRKSVDTANANIDSIPGAVGADALQSQIKNVARQIEEMARQQGYVYEVTLAGEGGGGGAGAAAGTSEGTPGAPGGGEDGGEGGDEDMITVLNQNMREVKVSLDFMQKVLDEKMNEPVVEESWHGVE